MNEEQLLMKRLLAIQADIDSLRRIFLGMEDRHVAEIIAGMQKEYDMIRWRLVEVMAQVTIEGPDMSQDIVINWPETNFPNNINA